MCHQETSGWHSDAMQFYVSISALQEALELVHCKSKPNIQEIIGGVGTSYE